MRPPAWMVELVDTTDLKSVDPKGRAGSSPAPGTKREIAAMRSPGFGVGPLRINVSKMRSNSSLGEEKLQSPTFKHGTEAYIFARIGSAKVRNYLDASPFKPTSGHSF